MLQAHLLITPPSVDCPFVQPAMMIGISNRAAIRNVRSMYQMEHM